MVGKKVGFLAAVMMSSALAMPVLAQNDPAPATQPAQQGNGGRRTFDPAAFRQQVLDGLKERLGATDDEFAAIQPKLSKVLELQRDAGGGRGMMGGGRRGRNGATTTTPPAGGAEQSAVQKASADLQATLDNKDSKPDDIKAKLDTFRAAKAKAKEDLAAAQKDLESVLTQRQEALLVVTGMLN
jgi:hypothetical protein